jgi:hypothetical protein
MDHQKHHEAWEKFLDPAVMQDRLISSSLFIAAFDSLKGSIVNRVKQFYQVGFGIGGDTLDPEYSAQVASRNSSPLYASLDWLKEHDAISQQDIDAFNEVKSCRNKLAHSLLSMIAEDAMPDLQSSFETLVALLRKVEVWWIVNVEIPTNPDFDGTEEIDEEGILPGPCMSMKIMMDVATGKSDYLNKYREQQANKNR